jgi:uncharacterized Zn finger protein
MQSNTVPQKLKLNLEEILLISKTFENKWLKTTKIRSKNNAVAKAAREEIMQTWKERRNEPCTVNVSERIHQNVAGFGMKLFLCFLLKKQ